MGTLIMIGQLLLGLSILIFVHELGHYLAARMFGIRVDKFFLFFDAWGFKLFSFKIGNTEYGMGWLPLGGYCKICGMIDESMDKESLAKEPQEYEYRAKPAWQRLIVITAGVIMNLVCGIFIFAVLLYSNKTGYVSFESINKNGIHVCEAVEAWGFRNGDKVLSINNKKIQRLEDASNANIFFGSSVKVERVENGEKKILDIAIPQDAYKLLKEDSSFSGLIFEPWLSRVEVASVGQNTTAWELNLQEGDIIYALDSIENIDYYNFRAYMALKKGQDATLKYIRGLDTVVCETKIDSSARLGIILKQPLEYEKYTLFSALRYACKDAYNILAANTKGMGKIVSGEEKASESLQGPIGMASIYGAKWIWHKFWYITAMVSLILAFMNILPIPALDGGHMVFVLYEIISGRKPSDKFLEKAQVFGMILLLILMFFVFGNDIFRLLK